jgi:transposase
MRRVHLKGRDNILKRLLVQAGGFNLALIMRRLVGIGKPRRLQGPSPASLHASACYFSMRGPCFERASDLTLPSRRKQ